MRFVGTVSGCISNYRRRFFMGWVMATFRSLRNFDTFGDVAAEDDAVLDYFLSTNAVSKIENRESFLVLGRKGTGKTAIVRYLTERKTDGLSKSLSLRGYPWNVHASRIDHGASDIEAYVSSWRYLIAVELAVMVTSHPEGASTPDAKLLKRFLTDNYGSINLELSDILRPGKLRLERLSLQPSVMGNQLGSVSLDRGGSQDHKFGLELNALSKSIFEAVARISSQVKLAPFNLHFDELDQGLSEFDNSRGKMLIGLILAARDVKREGNRAYGAVNPIVYLRTDLWDDLQFSDKNKINQTQTLHLGWNSQSLLDLVEARLKAKLGQTRWENIADPALMRGSQSKWNHILARTFLRPRDVIKFLNIALKEAKKREC